MNRGWGPSDFREPRRKHGRGSGEQYVRERFPGELTAYRTKANHLRSGLVVVIDADKKTVEERVREFEAACKDKAVAPRQKKEKVLFVIPKRNIETWLAYLRGETVDEEKKFPKHEYESRCHAEADKLDAMCKAGELDQVPPPSLEQCCEEFKAFWHLIQ
jgi:hypothetical protein